MKRPLITICISAHNEQYGIRSVLESILSQRQTYWKLQDIVVYCDGCTDDTAKTVSKINSKSISIVDDGKRIGKTKRLQQAFNSLKSDYLVIFDADIELSGSEVIDNLIKPFLRDLDVGLVGGNSRPYKPKTFFQNAVFSTYRVFYKSRTQLKDGHNIFGCTGSIMAIRRSVAKSIKFPPIINEDAYLYMFCVSHGIRFEYVDNAIVFYKLPVTIKDYIRQILRSEPNSVREELRKYFGNQVDSELSRPKIFYMTAVIRELIRNPVGVVLISLINIFCKPLQPYIISHYNLRWFTAYSTKKYEN